MYSTTWLKMDTTNAKLSYVTSPMILCMLLYSPFCPMCAFSYHHIIPTKHCCGRYNLLPDIKSNRFIGGMTLTLQHTHLPTNLNMSHPLGSRFSNSSIFFFTSIQRLHDDYNGYNRCSNKQLSNGRTLLIFALSAGAL